LESPTTLGPKVSVSFFFLFRNQPKQKKQIERRVKKKSFAHF